MSQQNLPVDLSPAEYPHTADRIARMLVAVMVNTGTDIKEAIRLVMGGK